MKHFVILSEKKQNSLDLWIYIHYLHKLSLTTKKRIQKWIQINGKLPLLYKLR